MPSAFHWDAEGGSSAVELSQEARATPMNSVPAATPIAPISAVPIGGFETVARVFEEHDLRSIEDEVKRVLEHKGCGVTVTRNGAGTIIVMNGLERQSDFFFEMLRRPLLLGIAEQALGTRAVPVHVEYFDKPSVEAGGLSADATPPHQDHPFYEPNAGDRRYVALWCALDPVSAESGALHFGPPPGRVTLEHCRSGTAGFYWALVEAGVEHVGIGAVMRGGCVIFDSFAVHWSLPNRTRGSRRAVVFNYREVRAERDRP
jgi:hypothetical protein